MDKDTIKSVPFKFSIHTHTHMRNHIQDLKLWLQVEVSEPRNKTSGDTVLTNPW